MENSERHIVEINGVKMEVDLRNAKVVENYRVGDQVKVLIKEYDKYTPYPGIIVGFDNFKNLPTVIIAYLATGYNEASVRFAYLNKLTTDCEIAPVNSLEIHFDKSRILQKFDAEISKAESSLNEIRNKKSYFLAQFGAYFKDYEMPSAVESEKLF